MYDKNTGKLSLECICCQNPVTIKMSQEQYDEYKLPKHIRRHMQNIFPELSPGVREMLISGICEVCWDDMFKGEN